MKQIKWRRTAGACLLAASVIGLAGCGIETIVGATVLGTFATVDRRTLGAQAEDKTITLRGESRVSELVGEHGHVNVTSYNRRVLLTGEVRDQQMKEQVERTVSKIENVQSVVNELEVTFVSSVASRTNDSYITSKVIASFIDAKDVFGSAIKVVTERGNVYLLGRVTYREGERAAEIASHVGGVNKVVKVFDYITEEELKRLPGLSPREGVAKDAAAPTTATPVAAPASAPSPATVPAPIEPAPTVTPSPVYPR
ncbi:MAG: BON domain-containing protein [Oxalobacter sp.]|nr:MAG: BON domain-containing protein [Oxalobacter sp.]